MNTRRAPLNAPLRQERWASSSPCAPGLLANLVAKIADQVDAPEDRKLLWWIQQRSWTEGGLGGLAEAMIAGEPQAVPRAYWTRVRSCERGYEGVPLGKLTPGEPDRDALAEGLVELAVNPDGVAFGRLRDLVSRFRDRECAAAMSKTVRTSTAVRISEALNRSSALRGVVLIEGPARMGKTTSVRDWCASSGGAARYVATPPGNDLDSLFRAIAGALGSASGLTFKAKQVEERIIRTAGRRGPALVFDDAFRLWPSGDTRQSHPKRLNWLLSLIDLGSPIALISTPQWWSCRRDYIAQTGWAVDQLDGRIGSVVTLPQTLTLDDCRAIARATIPGGPATAWEILANLAAASPRRLGALSATVDEARFIARQAGRGEPSLDDVKTAAGYAMATETRFAQEAVRPAQRKDGRGAAEALPPASRIPAAPAPLVGPARGSAPQGFDQTETSRLDPMVLAPVSPG